MNKTGQRTEQIEKTTKGDLHAAALFCLFMPSMLQCFKIIECQGQLMKRRFQDASFKPRIMLPVNPLHAMDRITGMIVIKCLIARHVVKSKEMYASIHFTLEANHTRVH